LLYTSVPANIAKNLADSSVFNKKDRIQHRKQGEEVMSSISLSRDAEIIKYLAAIGALLVIGGCHTTTAKQQIAFNTYPNLKLGFSTVSFTDFLPVSTENSKILIDYASARGFSWIELRDHEATLNLNECREIAHYARSKKIEVGYAISKGLLDSDFWQKFDTGLQNAAVFEGPGTFRAVACGNEFIADEDKKWWTADEFRQLVINANKAAQIAEDKGLQFVLENGTEALKGVGKTYFGLAELFEKANTNVGWQFDTANFFSGSRVWTRPQDVEAFLRKNINNLYYIHLKTSKNRHAQPVLGDNELDFDKVFFLMSKHDVPYVAVELSGLKNIDEAYKNHDKSIEYLRRKGFISVR
jgi:sugar phosphate isomerase/epimerase